MTCLTLSIAFQAALMAAGAETYAEAHKETTETGRPMVVMVGADWCPACVTMKDSVLPQIRQRGTLRRVAFATVNYDREQTLAEQLTQGGPIPQLLMFRRTPAGWRLRRLVGGQSAETIESFIDEGVKLSQQTEKAKTAPAQGQASAQPEAAPPKAAPAQTVSATTPAKPEPVAN